MRGTHVSTYLRLMLVTHSVPSSSQAVLDYSNNSISAQLTVFQHVAWNRVLQLQQTVNVHIAWAVWTYVEACTSAQVSQTTW